VHVNPVGKTNGSLVLIGNAHPGFNQVIDKRKDKRLSRGGKNNLGAGING